LLKDFIKSHPNEKEMKRALAVKLAEAGYKYRQISKILEVGRNIAKLQRGAT
jgi:transposase